MLFNTYNYFVFLPVVLLVYYLLPKVKYRNLFLLGSSYFFYMCWQPIFILLILISTLTDFFVGKEIAKSDNNKRRKLFLYLSLAVNLGLLFYFKYFNFLAENIDLIFSQLGLNYTVPEHSILLPVGISFYTFQTLSYTIDVYKNGRNVENNFIDFSLYVSFFPQLVAGPIERSRSLLPQFKVKHSFEYFKFRTGCLLILSGLVKKMVFADRFAIYADEIFLSPESYNGLSAFLGVVFFSFQIYGDFSGYSDIAIGSALLLGFTLMDNFKGPYFSTNIKEFWQRWHVSLSTWFRDYLYIPLGGNRLGTYFTYRNLILVFLATAIWHGANWTYVIWGLIHGCFLILERIGMAKVLNRFPRIMRSLYVFIVTTLAWTFFRAENISDAFTLIQNIFTFEIGNLLNHNIFEDVVDVTEMYISLVLLLIAFGYHFLEYRYNLISKLASTHVAKRWLFYLVCILSIAFLGEYGGDKAFIYFQF